MTMSQSLSPEKWWGLSDTESEDTRTAAAGAEPEFYSWYRR